MLEVLDALYIGAMIHFNHFIRDEKGAVDLVTVVVLIGIALALAIIFRDRIQRVVEDLLDNVEHNAQEATKK